MEIARIIIIYCLGYILILSICIPAICTINEDNLPTDIIYNIVYVIFKPIKYENDGD